MGMDDREKKFERALANQLRPPGIPEDCPDAEILAAYHERNLSLAEMAHWKEHIAACSACQETLALLEATEAKLLDEEWREHEVPVLAAAGKEARPGVVAARSMPVALEAAAAPAGAGGVVKKRPTLIRWSAPIAAIAAGVLVWIGVHQMRSKKEAAGPPPEIAMNRPAGPAEESAKLDTAPAPGPPTARKTESDAVRGIQQEGKKMASVGGNVATGGAAFGKAAAGTVTRIPRLQAPPAAAPSPTAKQPDREANARARDRVAIAGATSESVEVTAGKPLEKKESELPASVSQTVTVQATDAAPPIETAAAPPPPPPKSANAKTADQGQNELQTERQASQLPLAGRNYTQVMALSSGATVINVPDSRVRWRLGAGGLVQRSADGGKSWAWMDTGAGADLTAGSAPSGKVCWLVGKSGAVVLTIDGGAHWTKIATPISGDLGGVRATDAQHASIWDASKQVGFETSDGGATWKPRAGE